MLTFMSLTVSRNIPLIYLFYGYIVGKICTCLKTLSLNSSSSSIARLVFPPVYIKAKLQLFIPVKIPKQQFNSICHSNWEFLIKTLVYLGENDEIFGLNTI